MDSESSVTETKPPCPAGYERVRAGMKLIQLGVAGIALIIVLFALLTSTLQAEPLLLLWGLGAICCVSVAAICVGFVFCTLTPRVDEKVLAFCAAIGFFLCLAGLSAELLDRLPIRTLLAWKSFSWVLLMASLILFGMFCWRVGQNSNRQGLKKNAMLSLGCYVVVTVLLAGSSFGSSMDISESVRVLMLLSGLGAAMVTMILSMRMLDSGIKELSERQY